MIVYSLFATSMAWAASQSEPIDASPAYRADDYYLARRNLDNVSKAISIVQAAVSQDPKDYEALSLIHI